MIKLLSLIVIILTIHSAALAKSTPYYANIKVKEANVRTGPSVKYPIRWVYQRKNWPVKVTATFETWRKVSDIYGKAGWIHESLLSNDRYVVIHNTPIASMFELDEDSASIIQKVEKGVVGKLIEECNKHWCHVEVDGVNGWIKVEELWGIN